MSKGKKKSFVLRLDPKDYAALERWAADDFRSINGQLEWLINKALKEAGRKPGKESKDE
ncbi:Arc family DNA binding domain-containing protein [uncultured Sunxiuqinia sp.]|uniref:Arc family DNA binding domain-containing protein n=1 Tax=Sunxiuqinia rutila TaxID=1397841 RepID=UPI002626AAC4|nr:Arc family DNA binding domain-containing protein [uncultured Sunxiuqinia sp.]